MGIISMALMVIYATDSLFSFPDEFVSHGLLLAMALGLVTCLYQRSSFMSKDAIVSVPAPIGRIPILLPLASAGLALIFAVYLGCFKWKFEDHIRKAMRAYNTNQFEDMLFEATEGINPLVKLDPLGVSLEYFQGVAYARLGQNNKALSSFQQAQQLNPDALFIPNKMAQIYLQEENWNAAIRLSKQALRLTPRDETALRDLALANYGGDRLDDCVATITSFDYQNDQKMIELLASSLVMTSQFEQAVPILQSGLARFPESPELLELAGYVEYSKIHDDANAYDHLRRLLQLVPNHPKHDEYSKVVSYLAHQLGKPQPRWPTCAINVRQTAIDGWHRRAGL